MGIANGALPGIQEYLKPTNIYGSAFPVIRFYLKASHEIVCR